MLKQRVITGAVILALIVGLLCFSHIPLVIMTFVSILSMMAVYELFRVADMIKSQWVLFLFSEIFALVFPFLRFTFHSVILSIVFTVAMALSGWNMISFGKYDLRKSGIIFLISLALPILYSSNIYVRAFDNGLLYIILVLISCFATDTGAYFIGSAFGKHKLAPVISPKKSIEGFVGGVAINVLLYLVVGLVMQFGFAKPMSYGMLALLGLCCGVLDQFADLSLSAIKRNFKVKDFGNLMPGHGGVLDRFDSLLYVGAFVYLFILWIHPLYK